MDIIRPLHALGMSSGTALDGVDVALLKTDGVDVYDFGLSQSVPYDEELRDKIRCVLGKRPDTPENEAAIREVETELTAFHAEIANEIIAAQDEKVDVIGFEGHNICLDPKNHFSCQIGDGKRLAELTRTKVVNRFALATGGIFLILCGLVPKLGALVSIMAADTRIVNGQTLGSMLLALPDDDKAAAALEYIRNYPGITFEEVNG